MLFGKLAQSGCFCQRCYRDGAGTLPLAAGTVASYAGGEGLTCVARRARWRAKAAIVVAESGPGGIDPSAQCQRRYSCGQWHPGLCLTRDAADYTEVLQMAANLERSLGPSDTNHFYRLHDPESEGRICLYVFLAVVRARRSYARQTHVFARCDPAEQVISPQHTVVFRNRPGVAAFEFWSVWSLCQALRAQSPATVQLQRGKEISAEGDPLQPMVSPLVYIMLASLSAIVQVPTHTRQIHTHIYRHICHIAPAPSALRFLCAPCPVPTQTPSWRV